MEEIKLKISNSATNMIYKKILLRKFFNMVFIDANGRKLYMYIATVFGGITKDIEGPDMIYSAVQHDPTDPCSLQFEISSLDNSKLIESVIFKNLTQSFWEQSTCISKVWGQCTKLTNQKEVSELLKKTYPTLYPNATDAIVDVTKGIYYINQYDKPSHICIATQGEYEDLAKDSKYLYKLSSPSKGKKIDGLEVMNWVQVEINLSSNILNKPVLFSIELDQGKIYTPDFTWYFAPPTGNIVNGDSYVKFGKKGEERIEKNAIQGVSDETTIFFKEWKDRPQAIEERKKSRVLFKSTTFSNSSNLSEYEVLAIALHITNPQGPTNRQFLIGLLVAFLLAFCSDKTRINDFYTCLLKSCTCKETACICENVCNAISILAPILLLCSFLTFVLAPKKCFPPHASAGQVFFKICRILSLFSTSLLVIYVFGLWLIVPNWLRVFISCSKNNYILGIGFLIAFSANIAYLIYCFGFLKRKIFNYM